MRSFAKFTAALRRKLGATVVRTDDAPCAAASYDSSRLPFMPEAVIFPAAESDIGVVLVLANKGGVPVTTRGRGTTLTGGAAPLRGGWVIDMMSLNKIEINEDAGMAHVQCECRGDPARGGGEGLVLSARPVFEGILHHRW